MDWEWRVWQEKRIWMGVWKVNMDNNGEYGISFWNGWWWWWGRGRFFGGTMPTFYSTNTLDECVVLEMIIVISAA